MVASPKSPELPDITPIALQPQMPKCRLPMGGGRHFMTAPPPPNGGTSLTLGGGNYKRGGVRVRSATAGICGVIVALDSSGP